MTHAPPARRAVWPGALFPAGLVALADQAIKAAVVTALPVGAAVPLLPGLLTLTHVQNRGVAFGLLPGVPPVVIGLAAGLLVAWLVWTGGRPRGARGASAGGALMLGGTAGNLVDRLRWGYVVDYVDLHVWPVFNLADAAIAVGGALLVLGLARGAGEAGATRQTAPRSRRRRWR
ncbi:MAG: signal peptidase II [Armatimonadota bacterium]|nr:signal peptidase II [Armatimonadota bacterium]MDR7534506.1 signal peptidase II [Armatimonadota bacterium]MDR7536036.1 signal peptidase II [Armatimonadota bacterium]